MHISGVNYESIVDGIGVRTTIFVSGCLHVCEGCQNPKTHDFNYGKLLDDNLLNEIINAIKSNPLISGLTISGGDAMFSPSETIDMIKSIKKEIPHLSIWIYSGFTCEQIIEDEDRKKLLSLCDVLIDGLFVQSLRDVTLEYRGSTNQRCINCKETLKQNKIIECKFTKK